MSGLVQTAHDSPPKPHAALVFPFWQFPLVSQHPLGHVAGPQIPQTCDESPPPAPQMSGLVHATHDSPPKPHAALVSPFWQFPLVSQHPLGHVVGPHTAQTCDSPPTPQMSGLVQTAHDWPPKPHAALVSPFWQFPLVSQHPLGHVVGPHTAQTCAPPPTPQMFGLVQTTHDSPPKPHAALVSPF